MINFYQDFEITQVEDNEDLVWLPFITVINNEEDENNYKILHKGKITYDKNRLLKSYKDKDPIGDYAVMVVVLKDNHESKNTNDIAKDVLDYEVESVKLFIGLYPSACDFGDKIPSEKIDG